MQGIWIFSQNPSFRSTLLEMILKIITPAIKYVTVVIPAKAGIQKDTGCRIMSGMTGFGYLVAGLITMAVKLRIPLSTEKTDQKQLSEQ
jgi:hypothetical protein